MNGLASSLDQISSLAETHKNPSVDVLICPPSTLLSRAHDRVASSAIAGGGQDCHANVSGAHTGDISAQMLKDAGAAYVILGHSERRTDHGETDADVCAKARAVWDAELTAIICIGETHAERMGGQTLDVISRQLAGSIPDTATADTLVIAYEPVWAIGTGLTPTLEQIAEVHAHIRTQLSGRFGADMGAATCLLYGGSVKASNADEIFALADVDGALVGGASLSASDFSPIITALSNA